MVRPVGLRQLSTDEDPRVETLTAAFSARWSIETYVIKARVCENAANHDFCTGQSNIERVADNDW